MPSYREGQEDQLGALGLVVNTIILWNTISMGAALDQLRAEGVRCSRRGRGTVVATRP
jgi:TnpA family transposase